MNKTWAFLNLNLKIQLTHQNVSCHLKHFSNKGIPWIKNTPPDGNREKMEWAVFWFFFFLMLEASLQPCLLVFIPSIKPQYFIILWVVQGTHFPRDLFTCCNYGVYLYLTQSSPLQAPADLKSQTMVIIPTKRTKPATNRTIQRKLIMTSRTRGRTPHRRVQFIPLSGVTKKPNTAREKNRNHPFSKRNLESRSKNSVSEPYLQIHKKKGFQ